MHSLPPVHRRTRRARLPKRSPIMTTAFPVSTAPSQGTVRTCPVALDDRILHRAGRCDPDAAVPALRVTRHRRHAMIKVTKLKCLGGYRVRATFSDGMAGEYDFSSIVAEPGP